MDTPIVPQKRCARCGNEYPATDEYFQRNGKWLTSPCKRCKSEVNRAYRIKNAEALKKRKHDWQHANLDKVRAAGKRYRAKHADRIKALKRASVQRNRSAHAEAVRRWHVNHPDSVRAKKLRRRGFEAGSSGKIAVADVKLQYESQRGKCWWCGKPVGNKYHVDHRIPLAKGGTNDPGNLVISCPACNLSKGAKLPSEWRGRLL